MGNNLALTDDEKSAGVGKLLNGSYDDHYYSSSYGYPENHGKKWTQSDLELITKLFKSGRHIDYIANQMQRTCYSIAWQLYLMAIITEKQREAIKDGLNEIKYRREQKLITQKTSSFQVKSINEDTKSTVKNDKNVQQIRLKPPKNNPKKNNSTPRNSLHKTISFRDYCTDSDRKFSQNRQETNSHKTSTSRVMSKFFVISFVLLTIYFYW